MSYTAELTRHYSDIRKRLVGKPQPHQRPSRPVVLAFKPPVREGWRLIMDEVCERHGIGPAEIMEKANRSHARVRHARWEIWWRIRHEHTLPPGRRPTLGEIGKWFHRDHSTISYGIANHAVVLARMGNAET